MKRRGITVPLTAPQAVASTTAWWWAPRSDAVAAVVLAHGAGSDKNATILEGVGRGLAEAGCAVMAFNFAYAEAGRRSPDSMPRLQAAYRDVIADASQRVGDVPLVVGGRSMGGRVASMLVADGLAARGLLLLGYPLHPAGRPDRLRVDHWPKIGVPTLFVSGTRDSLFDLTLFEGHREAIPGPVFVHLLDGADHGFRVRRSDGRSDADVLMEVRDVSARWVGELVAP